MQHALTVNNQPDLTGEHYLGVLRRIHMALTPRTYFEIGTATGASLAFSACSSISVDPNIHLTAENALTIAKRPSSLFFNMGSDDFFRDHDPQHYFGKSVDLAFLDGMHWCEFLLRDFINAEKHVHQDSIIVLHDCLPMEPAIADRDRYARKRQQPHRESWWAGDVWKTALLLKRERPDLRMTVIDAKPTGLVLITNLDPANEKLGRSYSDYERLMQSWSLDTMNVENLMKELGVQPASVLSTEQKIKELFFASVFQ